MQISKRTENDLTTWIFFILFGVVGVYACFYNSDLSLYYHDSIASLDNSIGDPWIRDAFKYRALKEFYTLSFGIYNFLFFVILILGLLIGKLTCGKK